MSDEMLIIFAKYPEPGSVKTRLAKSIGESKAASLYRLFVETVLEKTQDDRHRRILFYTPADRERDFVEWIGNSVEFRPQVGNNLGERLQESFRVAFDKGAKKVVAIGTDSPLLGSELIAGAFEELNSSRSVIGPTSDGGYYLLGLSSPCEELFSGVDWGTGKVLEQTLRIARRNDLSYHILEERFDVDDLSDLFLLKRSLEGSRPEDGSSLNRLVRAVEMITAKTGCVEDCYNTKRFV